MDDQELANMIGRKVIDTGRYSEGFWIQLDDGRKIYEATL